LRWTLEAIAGIAAIMQAALATATVTGSFKDFFISPPLLTAWAAEQTDRPVFTQIQASANGSRLEALRQAFPPFLCTAGVIGEPME
jgi:hypothetical protein